MPRRTRLRISALEGLASELRYAPAGALRRQVERAAALAREIDPERVYARSHLVRRLTGYKPDAGDDGEELIVGAALRAEMSALIEALSERAGLTIDDLGPGALWLEDLCARWGVTARTVERRRREGLIGRRVRNEAGRVRLAFALADVECFEAEQRRTPVSAGADGASRGVGGARSAWARGRTRPRAAARREAAFAHASGAGVTALARARGASRSSMARCVREGRLEALRALDLRAPHAPTFEREDAAAVLLAPRSVCAGLGERAEADGAAFAALARAVVAPDEDAERARLAALCYLRWRATRTVGAAATARADALDRAETDLRWAARLCVALAGERRRLAMGMIEERAGSPFLELPADRARTLHALAMGACARAVMAFDPFEDEGRRLAGACAAAMHRALTRRLSKTSRKHADDAPEASPGTARRASAAGAALDDWTRRVAPWQSWLEPDARVRAALGDMDTEVRAVVEARYGWTARGEPPRTAAETARLLRMRVERVRALERRGLRVA